MMNKGELIPDFRLKNANGEWVDVKKSDCRKRLIYFYPMDQTQECIKQACSLNNWQDDFLDEGYQIIGISSDSVNSHQKFSARYELNFELLSDPKGKVRKIFGAFKFFGLLPLRVTYLTNHEGKIIFIYSALLNGKEHVTKALDFIKKHN